MPKRKPDTVTRIEFALNRTDREVIERYLLFEKADKASETISQVVSAFTGTPGGLIALWFVLDVIDDWAIPGDGIFDLTAAAVGVDSPDITRTLLAFLAPFLTTYIVAEGVVSNLINWADATEEQRKAAAPFRKKINDYAKAGKWLIGGYFVMVHGDDWLRTISGLLPSTEDLGALFAL